MSQSLSSVDMYGLGMSWVDVNQRLDFNPPQNHREKVDLERDFYEIHPKKTPFFHGALVLPRDEEQGHHQTILTI